MIEIKELSKILDVCIKKGVKSLEIDSLKVEFKENVPVKKYTKKSITKDKVETNEELTEEQILLWSSSEMNAGDSDV